MQVHLQKAWERQKQMNKPSVYFYPAIYVLPFIAMNI